jgi:hypothetical protein
MLISKRYICLIYKIPLKKFIDKKKTKTDSVKKYVLKIMYFFSSKLFSKHFVTKVVRYFLDQSKNPHLLMSILIYLKKNLCTS